MRRLAVVGVAILLLGFATLFVRDIAAAFDLEFTFVTVLGILAVVQSLRFVQAGRRAGRRATETGDPERRYEAPVPGDDVDESLVTAAGFSRYGKTTRTRLRQRVGEAAIAAVASQQDCPEAEARDRVAAGEWTDDPVAAWFLGEDLNLPARERARLLLSRGSRFHSGFSRTVEAIEAVEAGEAVETDLGRAVGETESAGTPDSGPASPGVDG